MNENDILQRIRAVPLRNRRRIVAIAGAPASGKSTLADELVDRIPQACVVPMDGFHRSNDDLERHGLLARKGAPETFDATAFVQFVRSMRTMSDLTFPTFDRANDCVVPEGGYLSASVQTIIVEGNYLLLNDAPWDQLAQEWDLSLMIEVPLPVLQGRLVERWLRNGHDAVQALARAKQNDIPNAELVIANSRTAGLVVKHAAL